MGVLGTRCCRMSVNEALMHEYVSSYHVPEDEPVMESQVEMEEEILGRDDIRGWRSASFGLPLPPRQI